MHAMYVMAWDKGTNDTMTFIFRKNISLSTIAQSHIYINIRSVQLTVNVYNYQYYYTLKSESFYSLPSEHTP